MLRELFGSPKPKNPSPATAKPAQPPVSQTVLGAGTQFEGTLRSGGHIRMDGAFTGDISARGHIIIGEQAKVQGNLVGDAVDVGGMVKGDITARRVSVLRTGRVLGNLRLEKLMTEEGGFIQGLVRMEEKVNVVDYLAKSAPVDEPPAAKEQAKEAPKAETEPEKVKVPVKASRS